jgi:hypothetical protein
MRSAHEVVTLDIPSSDGIKFQTAGIPFANTSQLERTVK